MPHATSFARRLRRWFAPAKPTAPLRKTRLECRPLEARDVPATISGTVFYDADANGSRVNATQEPGLAGRVVYVDTNANGSLDATPVTVASTNVPIAVPDFSTRTSTIAVSSISGTVADVNVTINVSHTFDYDLNIYLISPTGTRVELTTTNGGSGDNYTTTTFDDQAATSVTAGTAPFNGSYRPEGALMALNGLSPTGTWTLEISDAANLDSGTLNAWSIQFVTTATTTEPSAVTDGAGAFTLTGLPTGTARVTATPPRGWAATTPVVDGVPLANSTTTVAGRLFGQVEANSVRGTMYQDTNGNGVRDLGELAFANRAVQLTVAGGATATATTNADGLYVFTNVAAGSVTVQPGPLLGWTTTQPAAGEYAGAVTDGGYVAGLDFGRKGNGVAPAADVVDVTPDPRAVPVTTVTINFNESVQGFDLTDLTLTRGGTTVALTGASLAANADSGTWTLTLPADLTAANGTYVLTLAAGGVTDLTGTANTAAASDSWTMNDTTAPTVAIAALPATRITPVSAVAFTVSEPVVGFTTGSLSLTLNGGPNLLTGGQTLTASADGLTYTLNNLTALTGKYGTYTLTLPAGAFTDRAPNPLAVGASATWYNAGGVGTETRLPGTTASDQYQPAVAADAAGGMFAVWTSNLQDGSGLGVFGRQYNADTSVVTAIQINTTTAGDQSVPAIARNARGDTVIVWTSAGQDGGGFGVYGQRYAATGAAVGTEFRVNTTTAGDQSQATVAVAADGSFLVVWQSAGQDGNGLGVYGQRYAATGAAVGTEFRVNTTTAGDQVKPVAAVDTAGNAVIVWEDDGGADGSVSGIYAQRYASGGAAVGGEFRVNTVTSGYQVDPAVAMTPAGDFVVAWQSNNPDVHIAAQRYSAGGTAVGGEASVSVTTAGIQERPAVAVDAAGNALVVWNSAGLDGSGEAAAGRRWAADGTLSPQFQVNTYTTSDQAEPVVAVAPGGAAMVVWQSNGQDGDGLGVYAQRLASPADAAGPVVLGVRAAGEAADLTAGGRRTAPVTGFVVTFNEAVANAADRTQYRLTRNGVDVSDRVTAAAAVPSAATGRTAVTLTLATPLGDGDYVLTAGPTLADAAGNRLDGQGNGGFSEAFTTAFTVATGGVARTGDLAVNATTAGNQDAARVGIDAAGNSVVVWQSAGQDGSGLGVYGQRFSASGQPLGAEFRVPTYAAGDQSAPAVAMAADGSFVIAWTGSGLDGDGQSIQGQRFAADGTRVGTEFRVNATAAGNQSEAAAAIAPDGSFVVTWSSSTQDAGTQGVYGQRFAADGTAAGGEFQVNTYSPGTQGLSSVAVAANGTFVVVWQDNAQDGSGPGVYGQRFDAAGVKLGVEFRVNGTAAGNQTAPTVGSDAAGNFTVAWQGGNLIYRRRFAADGTALAGDELLGGGGGVRLAVAPTGDAVVVVDDVEAGSPTTYAIYTRRYDAAGTAVGGLTLVNAVAAGDQNLPAVAINASGDIAAVWRDTSTTGTGYNVAARLFGRQAAPVAVTVAGQAAPSPTGTRFGGPVGTVAVTFSGTLSTFGGAAGGNSVTNPANWTLTRNGTTVGGAIGSVTTGTDTATGRTTATVTFATALSTDGAYTLTASPAIFDAAGNPIDGDYNGTAGGAAAYAFTIAAVPLAGTETKANTGITAGDQTGAAVASGAAGNGVVVWQTATASSGLDVVGRTVSAAGVLGAEFTIGGAGDQSAPAVAADAAGNFAVAYTGPDTDKSGVFVQRYTAAGVALGTAVAVNTTIVANQTDPAIAVDADGDFVVAWTAEGQDGGGLGVYARRFRADGTPLGGEFRVNTTTANDQAGAAVAIDPLGNFTVAWQSSGQDGNAQGVYAQRYAASGAPLGGEFLVNQTTAGDQSQVSVGADAAGNLVFAWHGDTGTTAGFDVYTRRYAADGTALGGEVRGNTTTAGNQLYPAVAVDADGDYAVAWQSAGQDGNGFAIVTRRFRADGTAQTAESVVNTTTANDQLRPAVALDADGDALVAWAGGPTGNSDVFVQRYHAAATAPRVTSVVPNGGGTQRSQVTSLVVTFNRVMAFNGASVAAAFALTRDGGTAVGGFTATVATVNGVTVVTLGNFTGANTVGGSLADGYYTLTVNANQVESDGQLLDGDNNGTAGGNAVAGLHRYLGDFDGDTAVDGNDLAVFASAFNSVDGDSNYRSWLDLDGDGAVDGNDLAIFAQRFNSVL